MFRSILLAGLCLIPAVAGAQGLTIRDVVELSKAGLGEEALLALIEVNTPIFPVDPATIKGLKEAGVSQKVIVAMIRSGRGNPQPQPLPLAQPEPESLEVPRTPPPQVVVIDHHDEERAVREVEVPVPVYVTFPVLPSRHDIRRLDGRHLGDDELVRKRVEPVFWGWGGKLRPDAWKPTAADVQKDAKVPRRPQSK